MNVRETLLNENKCLTRRKMNTSCTKKQLTMSNLYNIYR